MSKDAPPETPPSLTLMGVRELPESITMQELLESHPLHSRQLVRGVYSKDDWHLINFPDDIRDHCGHSQCEGIRRHKKIKNGDFWPDDVHYYFVNYRCTDCNVTEKIFSVKIEIITTPHGYAHCTKIYQDPAFGQPIPKRLFKVIGEENREYFLQARRAIARSLGIGAYAYYRRIVENTKFDLVSSILEVAKVTNATVDQIALLEQARKETQFSKALDMIKDVSAIPAVLLIDGHNPLALLHDLLSEGIHQLTDMDCLERAKETEVILSEIAERMQIALTERKSVKEAITSIINRKKPSSL